MQIQATHEDGLVLVQPEPPPHQEDFSAALLRGLAADPPSVPYWFLYDEEGSRLFERITQLDAYYPTRAEREILEARAPEIVDGLEPGTWIIELGSGSSAKTRILLRALLERQGKGRYVPIDISAEMLASTARGLRQELPGLEIQAFAGPNELGLEWSFEALDSPRLLLWLGSSIGNLAPGEARAFLRRILAGCAPEDRLLIGLDLRKDRETLERAYDDPEGVTDRFVRNLLVRANRECGADFDREAWRLRSHWLEGEGRVEIGLLALRDQEVRIGECGFAFEAGDFLHVEDSRKFSIEEIDALAAEVGMERERDWTDERGRFTLVAFRPVVPPTR